VILVSHRYILTSLHTRVEVASVIIDPKPFLKMATIEIFCTAIVYRIKNHFPATFECCMCRSYHSDVVTELKRNLSGMKSSTRVLLKS
jgi:hypothetical protein